MGNTGDAKGDIYVAIEDLFGSNYNDQLTGDSRANRIDGGPGVDVLHGAAGNDTLIGGIGIDSLTGGANNDIFLFNAPLVVGNLDVVKDFSRVQDTMQLEHAVFTKIDAVGHLKAAAFKLGVEAADPDDRIIYNKATGVVFYDPDGSGTAPQIFFATLATKPIINNLDFFVV